MNRWCRGVLAAASLLTGVPGAARADILPPGAKAVRLSIQVQGDVPPDQALILAHTFRALDVLHTGVASPVEWHPARGKMQIMAVPAGALDAKIEERRQNLERGPLEQIVAAGKPCGEPFDGFRTVPITAPADEIRWVYQVGFSGGTCTATLVRMELYDKEGKPVPPTGIPDLPRGPVGTAAPAPSGAPSTAAPAASVDAAPPAASKRACGCEVGPGAAVGGAGAGALAALLGLALAARRRR